jgi:hypothetical protein
MLYTAQNGQIKEGRRTACLFHSILPKAWQLKEIEVMKHLTIRRIASSLDRFTVSVAHFSALVLHQKM